MERDIWFQQQTTLLGVERTLFLKGERVAVVYIDSEDADFTLAWPLITHDRDLGSSPQRGLLQQLLRLWFGFLSNSGSNVLRDQPLVLEFWFRGHFYERVLEPPVLVRQVFSVLPEQSVQLMLLNYRNMVLELSFEGWIATQCVCTLPRANWPNLVALFSRFHQNEELRNNFGYAFRAFADRPQAFGYHLNLLSLNK